ncbi:MAG: hypothetical protein JRJ85_28730, partial [Deltaproteobacteria bacterium]|nr:hypothetical protein [Deltaproteobacteria bacterium]
TRKKLIYAALRHSMSSELDDFVGSLEIVMPDSIRHPEHIEFTGFRLSSVGDPVAVNGE